MNEKIVKLINSGSKDDIILGMHLLGNYEWEEIKQFFKDNFVEEDDDRYRYEDCVLCTYFRCGEHRIYMGQTLLTIDPQWAIGTPRREVIIK